MKLKIFTQCLILLTVFGLAISYNIRNDSLSNKGKRLRRSSGLSGFGGALSGEGDIVAGNYFVDIISGTPHKTSKQSHSEPRGRKKLNYSKEEKRPSLNEMKDEIADIREDLEALQNVLKNEDLQIQELEDMVGMGQDSDWPFYRRK